MLVDPNGTSSISLIKKVLTFFFIILSFQLNRSRSWDKKNEVNKGFFTCNQVCIVDLLSLSLLFAFAWLHSPTLYNQTRQQLHQQSFGDQGNTFHFPRLFACTFCFLCALSNFLLLCHCHSDIFHALLCGDFNFVCLFSCRAIRLWDIVHVFPFSLTTPFPVTFLSTSRCRMSACLIRHPFL